MVLLDATDLRKAYGPRALLDGANLTIGPAERVGLLGLNGSGKSTLARILAGLETPDDGTLALRRGARVALLSQVPRFEPGIALRDAVRDGLADWSAAKAEHEQVTHALERSSGAAADEAALAALVERQTRAAAALERLGGWDVEHKIETLLGQLRIAELDGPVARLSGGEQRRVALARVLIAAPELAILDEPTNHLDADTIEWLEQYLIQSFGGALLLITHDRYMLDRVAQRTLELDHGQLYSYDGGYEAYLAAKAERLQQQARAEANRDRYLRRELEWLRRQPKARTGKQKARQQRIHAALDDRPAAARKDVDLRSEHARTGKRILEAKGLRVAIGERVLVDSLTLTLQRGHRIGIVGPSGCGKTTLLRTLIGEREPDGGELVRGMNTQVSYLGQLRDALDPRLSVRENVAGDRAHLIVGEHDIDIFSYLARFLFSGAALEQPVAALSGGERTRVALALLLARASNLMVLDEPTNDLDVHTIGALESMLLEFSGTVLVVSHDRWFLDRVATDIVAFEGGGSVVHSVGNYALYRELRERAAAQTRAEASERTRQRRQREAPPRRRGLTYAERLELEGLEGEVETADATVAALEARLADPQLYRARDAAEQAAQISAELAEARRRSQALTERWEQLELKREAGASGADG